MDIFVELTDSRARYLYSILKTNNLQVYEYNEKNIEKIKPNDAVVFSPAKKLSIEETTSLPKNIILFAGNMKQEVIDVFSKKNIIHKNYLSSEIFALKNANLTAEGILGLIIQKSNKSIFENNILIFGTGRVFKACAILFGKIGINYSVCNYRKPNYENAFLFTDNCFLGEEYKKHINNFDIIINTIPSVHITDNDSKIIPKDTIYIEAASYDGINREFIQNFEFVHAPGLPMKYCCFSAAKLMFDFIKGELE